MCLPRTIGGTAFSEASSTIQTVFGFDFCCRARLDAGCGNGVSTLIVRDVFIFLERYCVVSSGCF